MSAVVRRNQKKTNLESVAPQYDVRLVQQTGDPCKRVIADRQLAILKLLLEADETTLENLFQRMQPNYQKLKAPLTALQRDVTHLTVLGAVEVEKVKEIYWVKIRLEWTTEITETEFFEKVKKPPTAKTYPFL